MVEITIGGVGQLQGSNMKSKSKSLKLIIEIPEANIVESLIIDAVSLVCVFHQLMDGEGGVVRLYHGVRNLRGGDHGVAVHNPVRILLPDLGDKESPHARPGATTQTVGELESLQAVRGLGLLPDNIQDTVHQLSTFSVMALEITRTSLPHYIIKNSCAGSHSTDRGC